MRLVSRCGNLFQKFQQWGIWIILVGVPSQQATRADSLAEFAAKNLAWELEARRSVEIIVRTEIINAAPTKRSENGRSFNIFNERYIETSLGQRFGEFRGWNKDTVVSHSENYSDGTRYAHVEFDHEKPEKQNMVSIMRQYQLEERNDRRNIPAPLLYYYVGREPLPKVLPRAIPIGECQVLGRLCDNFLFRDVRWAVAQDQVFSLDRETATPLQVSAYRDEEARVHGEPLWTWAAESFEILNTHPLVKDSKQIAFGPGKLLLNTLKFHVESISYNKSYENDLFWPRIQPGADVLDGVTMKMTSGNHPKPAKQADATRSAGNGSPLEAVPPMAWSSLGSKLMLMFGVIAFIAAGLLLWRRR